MSKVENIEQVPEITLVMPCLNEAETIALCIRKAMSFFAGSGVIGEIIVADNGSTDGSDRIAKEMGAVVVYVAEKGYGAALQGGINAARSNFVIMGDSDDSHDLENLHGFVDMLRKGYDMVVGNRFTGEIEPGAMSWLNKYIGNPLLSGVGRIFFKSPVKDFHCGLRGFRKDFFDKLDLRTTGMEFASEMIVKASLFGGKMVEVPTRMFPSGRSRKPHLRPFRDGWRHLRFLMLYSPRWLFLYPGLTLILFGMAILIWLLPGARLSLDVHTMLYGATFILIGLQSVSFAVLSKVFAVHEELLPEHETLNKMLRFFSLEKGLIFGSLLALLGLIGTGWSLVMVSKGDFSALGITNSMRIVIISVTLLLIGFQIIFSSFFYSILRLKLK